MASAVVAILNTNDDLVEMLRVAIERAGLVATSLHVDDVRRGRANLEDFMREHNPKVVVYDVVAPYEQSWRYLDHLRSMPMMRDRQFVLTSPNVAKAMEGVDRPDRVFEIVGKPYDIDQFVDIVREAARARHTRD
jgi:DNA-binding NtrC family response regulator